MSNCDWIDASERRPEIAGRYLCFGKIFFVPDHNDDPNCYHGIKIVYYDPAYMTESLNWYNDNMEVSHWMSLPSPPDVPVPTGCHSLLSPCSTNEFRKACNALGIVSGKVLPNIHNQNYILEGI